MIEQRKITPEDIEAAIASEYYFTAAEGLAGLGPKALEQVTFCVLVLRNGTKISGVNYGSIDPAQHSAEDGRKYARGNAIEQIWPLLGYELRTKLLAQQGCLF